MLHFTEVLTRLDHVRYISGQELADINNVTRATIHNCIQKIDSLGIEVVRVRGLGYRLAHPVDLLDTKKITSYLPTHIQQQCSQIHFIEELDSTNKYASTLELPADNQFSVVLTEFQTAGKGRRGRQWASPYAANVYLSLVWPLQRPIHESGILSPMLALRVLQCLHRLGVPKLGIKWPNDIYCDQRKLAGLLIECSGEISNACKLVVGLGVNVSMSQMNDIHIDQPWTDIISHIKDWPYTRNELVARLITSLVDSLMLFENNQTNDIVTEWTDWDIMLNERVHIDSLKHDKSGTARGIDESGCLLLETNQGVEKISAGDVSLKVQK